MKIKIIDQGGHEILTLHYHLLDVNISKGRHVIVRSVANRYGLLCGTNVRKDAQGIGYIEVQLQPHFKKEDVILFSRSIIEKLL